jgi:hypothetical protein
LATGSGFAGLGVVTIDATALTQPNLALAIVTTHFGGHCDRSFSTTPDRHCDWRIEIQAKEGRARRQFHFAGAWCFSGCLSGGSLSPSRP